MGTERSPSGPLIPANTPAWNFQAWAAFILSALALGFGIYSVPGAGWVRPFFSMGMFFTIGSTFTLSKTIRDNRDRRVDTPAWIFQSWAVFLISVGITFTGIFWMPLEMDRWVQSYLGLAFLFCINSTVVLSKTIRDQYEADKAPASDHAGQDGGV